MADKKRKREVLLFEKTKTRNMTSRLHTLEQGIIIIFGKLDLSNVGGWEDEPKCTPTPTQQSNDNAAAVVLSFSSHLIYYGFDNAYCEGIIAIGIKLNGGNCVVGALCC